MCALVVLLTIFQILVLTLYLNADSIAVLNKGRVTKSKDIKSTALTAESEGNAQDASISSHVHEYITKRIDDIFTSKDFNTNWRLFTKLHFKEVSTDPLFYQRQRQDFHLYDPRITMSVYLDQISQMAESSDVILETPFSWQDWVDFSSLNDFLMWDESQRPTCEDVIDHGIYYNPLKGVKQPNHKIHESFCVDNINYSGATDRHLLPGFSITDNAGTKFNYMEKMIQSRSYLLSTMPQPEKLVFLTDTDDIFEVDVNHNNHTTMMENGMFDSFIDSQRSGAKKSVTFNPLSALKNFVSKMNPITPDVDFKSVVNISNHYQLEIPKSSFRYHPHDLLKDLKSKHDSLSRAQKRFVENLESQVDADMATVPKFFGEANVEAHEMNGHRVENTGHHYDLRFYNGFISESKVNFFDHVPDKQKIVLHQMLHTWLYFSFNAGAISYPAHGSLLSWYWNSMVFPWDGDVDVILPIQDLSNLCMNYNSSLIIQSPSDGFNKYYLDCTSSLPVREHGNGANNIDARFIDVDTGMYIDLTGLAVSGDPGMPENAKKHFGLVEAESDPNANFYDIHDKNDIYNCRNFHFYSHSELSPLRFTMMEHAPAFVPSNIKQSLISEYNKKALTDLMYQHHIYIQELDLWVPNQNILKAARKHNKALPNTDEALLEFYKNMPDQLVKTLLTDDDILVELTQVSFQTKAHSLKTKLVNKIASEWDFDIGSERHEYLQVRDQYDNLMKEYLAHHSPMRKSPFDYKIQVEMLQLNMNLHFTRQEVSKFI